MRRSCRLAREGYDDDRGATPRRHPHTIDDFGTGYANLGAIVASIVALGLCSVAEGAETADQISVLL